jgi:DNA polymerase
MIKEFIQCNCNKKECRYFESCDMLPTEVIRHKEREKIDILVFGQGSGETESKLKKPFVGRAGSYMRHIIKYLWDKGEIFNIALSNNIRFRPTNLNKNPPEIKKYITNREPTIEEINRCKIHLLDDINLLQPEYIIPLGKNALKVFMDIDDNILMKNIRGKLYNINNLRILPTYHPSFLLRQYNKFQPEKNNYYDNLFIEDIKQCLTKK